MPGAALKIGFVLDDTLDTPDGVQQYVLTLGRWLCEQGHEVHYLVGKTIRTDIPNIHSLGQNVHVKFNGNHMSTPLPASRREIKTLLAQQKFDVLHVQIPYSPFLAKRIIAAAPKQTAVVGTFHIAPHDRIVSIANKLLNLLIKRSLKRFDAIYSVSQAAADFALHAYGITTNVLPNVVNSAVFAKAEAMPLPNNVPMIMFLGRLVPRKGCAILLEALHRIHSSHPDLGWQTVICGKGPLKDELERNVQEHQIQNRVTFTGFVTDEQKARYLKAADIAVFPSTGGESFGIVLLEAMAAGRPVVIAADNPGYHTVMSPYPQSLVPVDDAQTLAQKLTDLLQDEQARKQALLWQQRYVLQFDVSVVGRRLVMRYQELLRARSNMR